MVGFFVEGTVASCYSPLLAGEVKHKEEVRRQRHGGGGRGSPDFLILVWFPAYLLKFLWDLKVHLLFLGINPAMEGSTRDWKLHLELSMNDAEKKCWPRGVTGPSVSVLTRLLELWESSTSRQKQRHSAHSDKGPATARWQGPGPSIPGRHKNAGLSSHCRVAVMTVLAVLQALVDFSPELLLSSQCGALRDIF